VSTFPGNVISLLDLTYYGISTSETSFIDIHNLNGLLYKLTSDLTDNWVMYNGSNVSGNELIDSSNSNVITKRFFNNIFPSNGYDGNANYTNIFGATPQQHVVVLETTNELLNEQPFRLRFEYDERPRLYKDDVEFNDELIQTNIRLQSMGYEIYLLDNIISDSTYMSNENIISSHIGYTFNGVLSDVDWKENIGIPNPMYGWLKVNVCSPFGLLDDGSISGNISYMVIARSYGELVDISYKDILIPGSSRDRSYVIRNKVRGYGWFKPHLGLTSYRLTMTERGFSISLYHDTSSISADDNAWFVVQRTVDNNTGLINTNTSNIFETNPIHCLYSCSLETKYPSDLSTYYTTDISTLQTTDNTTVVYDKSGLPHNLYSITDPNISYGEMVVIKIDNNDLDEMHLVDNNPKDMWRFVVREINNILPTPVHFRANRDDVDSEAVINNTVQHSITESNQILLNFPTRFTTPRCVYPSEELDLLCFTSADVVAYSSLTSVPRYSRGGVSEVRQYCGLRSTLPNEGGMRVMMLCDSDYILNSDVV
jgi:hypothetical protein